MDSGVAGRIAEVFGYELPDVLNHAALDGLVSAIEHTTITTSGALSDQAIERTLEASGVRKPVAFARELAEDSGLHAPVERTVVTGEELEHRTDFFVVTGGRGATALRRHYEHGRKLTESGWRVGHTLVVTCVLPQRNDRVEGLSETDYASRHVVDVDNTTVITAHSPQDVLPLAVDSLATIAGHVGGSRVTLLADRGAWPEYAADFRYLARHSNLGGITGSGFTFDAYSILPPDRRPDDYRPNEHASSQLGIVTTESRDDRATVYSDILQIARNLRGLADIAWEGSSERWRTIHEQS